MLLILKSKSVATPPAAATGVVPLSVPPPGLAPSATLTLPVNPDTRFPSASTARTFTAGLIWRPAMVVPGWMPNADRKSVVEGKGEEVVGGWARRGRAGA